MKQFTFLVILLISFSSFGQVNEKFEKRLNSEELQLCKTFRDLSGKERVNEMSKITELFPVFSREKSEKGKIDSREHAEYFLGKPDHTRQDNKVYVYTLNAPDKNICTIAIFFDENGLITFTGFENCVGYFK